MTRIGVRRLYIIEFNSRTHIVRKDLKVSMKHKLTTKTVTKETNELII